MNSFFSAGW